MWSDQIVASISFRFFIFIGSYIEKEIGKS